MLISRAIRAGLGAVLALALSVSVSSAVTLMNDGDSFLIGPGLETEFAGDVIGNGGMGAWFVEFESTTAGAGEALVTIGPITASTFTDLTLAWFDLDTFDIISSIPITPMATTLSTMFVAPGLLNQALVIGWTDSLAGFGFDVEVSVAPVPLPFAGALLITGIAGLGLVRRRSKSAS